MKFALLAGSTNYKEVNEKLLKAAGKLFTEAVEAPFPEIKAVASSKENAVIFGEKNLCGFDAVYPRTSSPDIEYAPIILDMLIDAGVYSPIQPDAITIAKNKFYTLKIMAEAGLPTPKSVLITSPRIVESVVKDFEFPVVVKLQHGMAGKGVMLVSSQNDFPPIIDAMAKLHQTVNVEEFIKNPGEDHRLFVVGDEVVAAMKRKAVKEGEFRTNITIGGKPEPYKPTKEEVEIALKAANTIGMEICGVDLIPSEKGPVLIEINDGPSFKGISTVTTVDLYKAVGEFIFKRAKS
ncbi:MAG: RimK family alpha-L-glutamate ligase [Candidatus Diapherotrites archaeon]|nr:RimK family alpha-L-glutamate ligase [Candidatus Diapherotrites archaeon]